MDSKKFETLNRPLSSDERESLKKSIAEHGCQHPVIKFRDVILDGHHRQEICDELGIAAPVKMMVFRDSEEAYEFAIGLQLGRRNLTKSDRDQLLGELYRMRKDSHGGDRKSEIPEEKSSAQIEHLKTCDQIASEHGVSAATVRRAAEAVEARERLTPAARVVVDSGSVSHADLVKLSELDSSDQDAIAGEATESRVTVRQAIELIDQSSSEESTLSESAEVHRVALRSLAAIKSNVEALSSSSHGDYLRESISRFRKLCADMRVWLRQNEPVAVNKGGQLETRFESSQRKKKSV